MVSQRGTGTSDFATLTGSYLSNAWFSTLPKSSEFEDIRGNGYPRGGSTVSTPIRNAPRSRSSFDGPTAVVRSRIDCLQVSLPFAFESFDASEIGR